MKKYSTTAGSEIDIKKLFNSFIVKFGFYEAPKDEYIKTGEYFLNSVVQKQFTTEII